MPELRKLLTQESVTFPVIHRYEGDGINSFGWNAPYRPWTYLIDPQGNIVGNFWVWDKFEPVLDYFLAMEKPYQPNGIEVNLAENPDGSYSMSVSVTSPSHEPVSVSVFAEAGFGIYGEKVDGEWQWLDYVPEGKEPNSTDFKPFEGFEDLVVEFEFGEFGEATKVFQLSNHLGAELRKILYGANYELPGIEVIYNGHLVTIDDQENLDIIQE